MKTKNVYQDPVLNILVEEITHAVILDWKITPTSQEFRNGLNKGLEVVKENKINKWVGNCTNMGAISPEDQKWSNEVWFPQAISAGINRMGVIVSDDIFNQMSVEEIMSNVESVGLISQYFPSIEKTIEWLKTN